MLIPIAIFLFCLFAGAAATARWLPDLAPGPIGGLTLLVVCGLVGLAVGDVAMHVYLIIEEANELGTRGTIAADELASMAWESGALLALAMAAYLLGPEAPEHGLEARETESATPDRPI